MKMQVHDSLTGGFTGIYADVKAIGLEDLQRLMLHLPEQLEHGRALIISDLEKVCEMPEWNDQHVSGTDWERILPGVTKLIAKLDD